MTPLVTTLPSGLRIVSHEMPHLETVSLGVWVGVGARHEPELDNGISHMLEHMAFKGTESRSARRIAEDIEQVGGELNAATSLESTAYYARVLKGDEGVALDILADILQRSLYAEPEVEREREVILQEIAGIRDSPDELAYDLLQDAAFPDQPVGRPIIGTPDSVGRFTATDLRRFLDERYVAPSIVLSAAGAICHYDLVRHAGALFGSLNGGSAMNCTAASYVGGIRASEKVFEQSHLVLGFKGLAYGDPEFFATQVYSGLMGGGMSSRLFQEVRESRGLCYAIYSSAWGLSDGGLFTVHAATGADLMEQLVEVVAGELVRSAETAPPAAEVERAKAQLKAGLLMGLESSSARAEQMARHLMAFDRLVSPRELIERVESVTPEGVRRVAERMLCQAKASAAVVGAGVRSQHWAEVAHSRLTH
ncbi:MAG: M16 family metallopeptidase [Hyphomicrobiaceae bacterium]